MLTLAWMFLMNPMNLDARVENALSQLTIEEKIDCLGGVDSMFTRPIPKLGIPRLRMSDGPAGIRCWGKSTAYAAPIALAASFNEDLMQRFGEQMAADALARDTQIILGPGVNLARVPQNGRNFEYFGEDPYLAGRCAVRVINAIQGKGVAATIKHFVANDHENDRLKDTSNVDEAVLREIYLWPFEMAVKQAAVKCLMTGYNRLNGTYASQHDWLNNQLLKKEWGFQGVHMSDWGGTHDGVGAALGGLDLEMPDAAHMNQKTLSAAVKSGIVPASVIDDKVRRLLRLAYEMGWDKHVPRDPKVTSEDPRSAEVSREIARQGIVLLTNRDRTLPLAAGAKIALTGFQTDSRISGGGGSAYTDPFEMVTLVQAMRKQFGEAQVSHFPAGGDSIPSVPMPAFRAEYFKNKTLSGAPAATRQEAKIDFHLRTDGPIEGIPKDDYSIRWTNQVTVEESGNYMVSFVGDDGYRVKLDGKWVISAWQDQAMTKNAAVVTLKAGQAYPLVIEYYQAAGEAVGKFSLTPLFKSDQDFMQKFGKPDVVVASVGFQPDEGEGNDRPFDLPLEQSRLLDQLVANHKKVVIVVNSGGAVNLTKWADKAAAIVQAWYPGGNGNEVLAEILAGKTNPCGKLPCSFPVKLEGTYYEKAYPPVNGTLEYREGLYMGYRSFDHDGTKPLFAFGHGLSYSQFELSDVKVEAAKVAAKVTHKSGPAGAAVLQVYVGRAKETPLYRQLKAFARVELKPGESKRITMPLDERAFARWNAKLKIWRVEEGSYTVQVGFASDEVIATQTVTFVSAKTVN